MPSPSPICCFPLLTSPPPALTLPGGRGGEERPQATKGEGGKGSWLLPGAVGVKPLLPQNPQFLVLQLLTGGRPQYSLHFLSMTPALVRSLSGRIRGNLRDIKDGGGRNRGNSLLPSLLLFTFGDPCPQPLSILGPFSWPPLPVPSLPSPTLSLLSATHPLLSFRQPLPGSCVFSTTSMSLGLLGTIPASP